MATVTFRWKDYAHGNKKRMMTVTADEFLRRFLLHTLPRGFVRIRFCGFLADRRRRELLPSAGSYWSRAPARRSVRPDTSGLRARFVQRDDPGRATFAERLPPDNANREAFADTS